jgi:hypothetical protein
MGFYKTKRKWKEERGKTANCLYHPEVTRGVHWSESEVVRIKQKPKQTAEVGKNMI